MRKRISCLFLLAIVLSIITTGCNYSSDISSLHPIQADASAVPATVLKTFSEILEAIDNPYMGWVEMANDFGNRYSGGNLVFARASWRDLEPVEGVYDFCKFEESINYDDLIKKGYKFVFLFYLDWPDKNGDPDLPDWVLDMIKNDGTKYTTTSNVYGFSPDYGNTEMMEKHRLLIKNIAQRYNNSGTFCVLLGSVGHWGELHTTYISDSSEPGYYPDVSVESAYLQPYCDYFTNCYLSLREPRALGIKYKTGLHNHAFGDYNHTYLWFLDYINNGYTDNTTKNWHPAMPEFWKIAPSAGEFLIWPGTKYLTASKIGSTLKQVVDTHLTWLMAPPENYVKDNADLKSGMNKMLRKMGYRLVLNSAEYTTPATVDSGIRVTMKWSNTGIAPCYFNWPMELSLVDSHGAVIISEQSDVRLKSWLPGQKTITAHLKVPYWLKAGTYKLNVAFINPDTDEPGIRLAISAENTNLRYEIGDAIVR